MLASEVLETLSWSAVDEAEFRALGVEERLRRVRHSAAHVMADAARRIRPDVQLAIGPPTADGFFYDMKFSRPLDEEDLKRVQQLVEQIASERLRFEVAEIPREAARRLFEEMNQPHKLQILEGLGDAKVTLYRHGTFVDLCAGPHAPHTGYCRFAQVLGQASAHWRGEASPTMTRLSGTAWESKEDLKAHLRFLEEARKRDHRVIGPQLDLFSFHEWAAAALWHPDGLTIRKEFARYWAELMGECGYEEIWNPLLYKKELFQTSGHWEHYQEDMFAVRDPSGEVAWVLKPMNCPDTMLYFRSKNWSYRDLPARIAESQVLHRNEQSGNIHGVMRTRNFVQDDAHIFLGEEHIQAEIASLIGLVEQVYSLLGLEYSMTLSTRPESFMGEIEAWEDAEAKLEAAMHESGVKFDVDPGGGAFYGPKIDVRIRDSLGRRWQCGTIQLDFQIPRRFDLHYTAADGSRKHPIVIHRAIFGSFERFIGVLIEHFNGRFPTWLAPVQAMVLPITDAQVAYGKQVVDALKAAGVRVRMDAEGSVNARVRTAEKIRAAHVLIVGQREMDEGTVSLRARTKEEPNRTVALASIVEEIREKIAKRTLDVKVEPLWVKTSEVSASSEAPAY